jgi:amidohydrolase
MKTKDLFKEFRNEAKRIEKDLISLRRHIHRHPEPRWEEWKTSALVAERMKALGLETKTHVPDTAVIALLRGAPSIPRCVALRADLDALAIADGKKVDYASCVPNVAHACGHDVHVTVVVGVATVLAKFRDQLPGAVKFIFQPSEEIPVEDRDGAREVIQAGGLENPHVDAIFGLHCWPELRAGQVGINVGPTMACATGFTITVRGEKAHAGTPHFGRDALLAMSQTIVSIHHLISRRVLAADTVAINIGTISGGKSRSIVADCVAVEGTMRTFDVELRERLKQEMRQMVVGISQAYGTRGEIQFSPDMPPVINDERLAAITENAARAILGQAGVVTLRGGAMTSENFALYIQDRPGFYLKLGVANPETGRACSLHHELFDVDERAIEVGVSVLSAALYEYLASQ